MLLAIRKFCIHFDRKYVEIFISGIRLKIFRPKCIQFFFCFHICKHSRCNELVESGVKLPLTSKDSVNNCDNYHEKLFGLYEQAIRLAIADRLQTEDKVILQLVCLFTCCVSKLRLSI